jgi:hypothetical protein
MGWRYAHLQARSRLIGVINVRLARALGFFHHQGTKDHQGSPRRKRSHTKIGANRQYERYCALARAGVNLRILVICV